MPEDADDLIRRAYDAYGRGDLTTMLELIDQDLEWTYLDPAFEHPEPQVCHGRDELAAALRGQQRRGLRSARGGHRQRRSGRGRGANAGVGRPPGVEGGRSKLRRHQRDGRIVALRACHDREEALAVLGSP